MKKTSALPRLFLFTLSLFFSVTFAEAAKTPMADITLKGAVERAGLRISNDTTLFEGDAIRTLTGGNAVLRIGRGRLEIFGASEVALVQQNPLRIVVKSGTVGFNFPVDMPFEIVTPQLETAPNRVFENHSGIATVEPQQRDRIISRAGAYIIKEREKNGATRRLEAGQILIATLTPDIPLNASVQLNAALQLGGALGSAQIAILLNIRGDVRVNRAATPRFQVPLPANATVPMASGDRVQTFAGVARVTFLNEQSTLELSPGTVITIQQRANQNQGIARQILQTAGSFWFNIQRLTNNTNELRTPTAVAAIRGTTGVQEVVNEDISIHSLDEGQEQITENETQSSVVINGGQTVTAIRGVGFTVIGALAGVLAQPSAGGGGGAGAGAGGGGGGAGAGAGAGAGVASGSTTAAAATASITSTVATVAIAATIPAATTAVVEAREEEPASRSNPLNPPGAGF